MNRVETKYSKDCFLYSNHVAKLHAHFQVVIAQNICGIAIF